MRFILSLAGTLALASCAHHPAPATPAQSLRVMTYNIQAGAGNLDGIADVIRSSGAEIVALQEVDVHWHARSGFADQAAVLADRLGMQVRFAPIYQLPGASASSPSREYGVALLSRHPIVAFTNHQITRLSTQADATAPTPMPGLLEAVVAVGSTRVRVFNTHFDYRADPSVRRRQVAETLSLIGSSAIPTLMFGDFNAGSDAPELAPLLARLHDTWTAAADAGYTYPSGTPAKRIDYILASAHFRSAASRVLDRRESDHRPVVADLVLAEPR